MKVPDNKKEFLKELLDHHREQCHQHLAQVATLHIQALQLAQDPNLTEQAEEDNDDDPDHAEPSAGQEACLNQASRAIRDG